MGERKEYIMGNKYEVHSGGMVLNFVSRDSRQTGSWKAQEAEKLAEDFEDFEEVEQKDEDASPKDTLNYFAPKKHLKELLRGEWFKTVRTSAAYDERWTDGMVDALMASEWQDTIAQEWAGRRGSSNKVKGHIIGLLVDGGVLKGSYNSVAQAARAEQPRTFARYMSEGKRQPYAAWMAAFVKG